MPGVKVNGLFFLEFQPSFDVDGRYPILATKRGDKIFERVGCYPFELSGNFRIISLFYRPKKFISRIFRVCKEVLVYCFWTVVVFSA